MKANGGVASGGYPHTLTQACDSFFEQPPRLPTLKRRDNPLDIMMETHTPPRLEPDIETTLPSAHEQSDEGVALWLMPPPPATSEAIHSVETR